MYRNIIDHKGSNKTVIMEARINTNSTLFWSGKLVPDLRVLAGVNIERLYSPSQDVTTDPTLPRTRDTHCPKCAGNEASRLLGQPLSAQASPVRLCARKPATDGDPTALLAGCLLLDHNGGGHEPFLPVHKPAVPAQVEGRRPIAGWRRMGVSRGPASPLGQSQWSAAAVAGAVRPSEELSGRTEADCRQWAAACRQIRVVTGPGAGRGRSEPAGVPSVRSRRMQQWLARSSLIEWRRGGKSSSAIMVVVVALLPPTSAAPPAEQPTAAILVLLLVWSRQQQQAPAAAAGR